MVSDSVSRSQVLAGMAAAVSPALAGASL